MRAFWLRLLAFMLLASFLIFQKSSQMTISLLTFTVALILFFLLSYQQTYIYVYIMLSSILIGHGFFINESLYTSLLILLVVIISSFRLRERRFTFYLLFNAVLILVLFYFNKENIIVGTLLVLFVSFLLLRLNSMEQDRLEQQGIYENLLVEYRKLKRMHVSAEREMRLEERTRIARELHDSVGHRLTALIMKIEMLSIQEPNENYGQLKKMANESLQETREAVQALQVTDTEGLAAVVHLIRKLEAESHLLIQFTLKQGTLTIPISNKNSAILYRIIQEALTNVMRHSQSKEVKITLGKSAIESLSFSIENPITDAGLFQLGFGLKTMKKRVEEIGGHIDIYQTDKAFVIKGMMPTEEIE